MQMNIHMITMLLSEKRLPLLFHSLAYKKAPGMATS